MNRKYVSVLSVALGLALGSACQKPAAQQEEQARDEQQKANETIVESQREAAKATNEAQAEANKAQLEANEKAAQAQREAHDKAVAAQGSANEERREAAVALDKQRADYREKAQHELNDLTKSLDDLKTKAVKAEGPTRAQINADVRSIETRRVELEREVAGLNTAVTAAELDRRKAELDKRIADLRDSVRATEDKI